MNEMLSQALRDYHGLREQLDRALLGDNAEKWGKDFRTFMRGEPTHTEGMIYIPLEWSRDFGPAPSMNFVESLIVSMNSMSSAKNKWRLPSDKELSRALKVMKPKGFELWKYYRTSTPDHTGSDFVVIRTYDGHGGLGRTSVRQENRDVHVRLCREVEIPGQE